MTLERLTVLIIGTLTIIVLILCILILILKFKSDFQAAWRNKNRNQKHQNCQKSKTDREKIAFEEYYGSFSRSNTMKSAPPMLSSRILLTEDNISHYSSRYNVILIQSKSHDKISPKDLSTSIQSILETEQNFSTRSKQFTHESRRSMPAKFHHVWIQDVISNIPNKKRKTTYLKG